MPRVLSGAGRRPTIASVDRPETRYAWNGDLALAYQVVGEGPIDLVYVQGYASQVDVNWESPYLARFLRGLSRHARLIITDRRGWGASDRFSPSDIPDIDELTDDLLAVMDAAGSARAGLLATFECTLVATLFAASYPERVAALILVDPFVTYAATTETPWMPALGDWEEEIQQLRVRGGIPSTVDQMPDGREREWFTRLIHASMAPGGFVAEIRRHIDTDVRAVLPTIQVPTLLSADAGGASGVGDLVFDSLAETARFAAQRIPGARVVEHSSAGGLHRVHWYARGDAIVDEVGRFLARVREEEASFDRVLATVLFTDVVGSTSKSAAVGDHAWQQVMQSHDATVRALLARYRGTEIDTAGDGFFASFDGPARAVRCALAIVDAVRPLGIEVRAGLHTGEVETTGEKIGGLAVSIGARVGGTAEPSEVLVSQTVRDLVAGSGLAFEDRGSHELKGVPDSWHLYRVIA